MKDPLFMRKTDRKASEFLSEDLGHKTFRQMRQLEVVAERLNENLKFANSSNVYLREAYEAYKLVEQIVLSKSLVAKGAKFNALAAQHPLRLRVEMGRMARTHEEIALPVFSDPTGELSAALSLLWQCYFHRQGWMRLKPCPICSRWFVDLTSDKRKERCSAACTDRWWSYGRRKEADYTRFRKGGYHGTKRR